MRSPRKVFGFGLKLVCLDAFWHYFEENQPRGGHYKLSFLILWFSRKAGARASSASPFHSYVSASLSSCVPLSRPCLQCRRVKTASNATSGLAAMRDDCRPGWVESTNRQNTFAPRRGQDGWHGGPERVEGFD